jgi:hypothetical protein
MSHREKLIWLIMMLLCMVAIAKLTAHTPPVDLSRVMDPNYLQEWTAHRQEHSRQVAELALSEWAVPDISKGRRIVIEDRSPGSGWYSSANSVKSDPNLGIMVVWYMYQIERDGSFDQLGYSLQRHAPFPKKAATPTLMQRFATLARGWGE